MENLVFDATTGIITVTLNMGDVNFLNQFTNDILEFYIVGKLPEYKSYQF
jgi:hypothetical protein